MQRLSLQSAIDAILAQLAILNSGGGSNLINAQAWPGETTWDLLLGTNTLRNLHFNAPLSVSLQNDNFTLSLACDSYSIAQTDAAIATALLPYETAAQRDAAIAAALIAYSTTIEMNTAITTALLQHYTATQVDNQIATAIAGIDLTPYYTSAQTDAAITAALKFGTRDLVERACLGRQPAHLGTVEGHQRAAESALRRALERQLAEQHRHSGDRLRQLRKGGDLHSGRSEQRGVWRDRRPERNPAPHREPGDPSYRRCIGALLHQRRGGGVDLSDYYTKTQSDSRYFVANATGASSETFTLIRDTAAAPRQLRGILPRSPLSFSPLLGHHNGAEVRRIQQGGGQTAGTSAAPATPAAWTGGTVTL